MSTLVNTPGVVLHCTHYSESSVIARIFTRELGVRSFMVKGVRGRNGRVKQNMLQPLSVVELTAYNNPRADLHYVKEMCLLHDDAAEDSMVYNALRFFKAELLYKTLREEVPQPELFDYVADGLPYPAAHQPVMFMLQLSRHLGIEPLDNYSRLAPYFEPDEGRFGADPAPPAGAPGHGTGFDGESSLLLHHYLQAAHNTMPLPAATQRQRNTLVDLLIAYYSIHLNGFRHFTSHDILHTVLN
ncbi:MAG: DNA repair protein RecO (recombination protein O) [bacterium P3]|nr:MAG: DNA repair protein RecO (recombination protein O) [bacterium P3]KWW41482.1 MAG: DNA repair protein RecO (recombination protein O) [bacterium F083]